MNVYHLAIFMAILSNTVLSYPSYSNRLLRQKYRLLGMIMPPLPSLIRDDRIGREKFLSLYGKIFHGNSSTNETDFSLCSFRISSTSLE